ncbi:hypothetical protein REH76_21435, partial [Photobacterium damselae]
ELRVLSLRYEVSSFSDDRAREFWRGIIINDTFFHKKIIPVANLSSELHYRSNEKARAWIIVILWL